MEQEAARRFTREEALAMLARERWDEVNSITDAEARRATPERRFADLSMLVSGRLALRRPQPSGVEESLPDPLREALNDTLAWLAALGVRGVVIGGIAVGLLGRPRYTKDIDLLIDAAGHPIAALLRDAAAHGLRARFGDAAAAAERRRFLALEHVPTGEPVDVLLATVPQDLDTVSRASLAVYGTLVVPLPTIADLVVMKALAHRLQDLADIDMLLAINPEADVSDALRIVAEVAASTAMPDLVDDLRKIVARRRP